WLANTDEEVDEQELEAHYSYMAKIQEVPNAEAGTDSELVEQVQNNAEYNVFANGLQHSEQFDSISNTCSVETNDSYVIPDSPDMCEDDIQNDQNDVEIDDERVMLANLIANLKLDQYQNEVNELRAEKLARNANPLALVANAQASQDPFYQSSRSHRSQAPSQKPSIPTRSHTSTRHKGKEIAKLITPPSETASEEDIDLEQAQRDKDMQKNLSLIAKYFKKIYKPTTNNLRTSLNFKNKNVDTTSRFKNDSQSGQFGTQRTVNVAGTRDKVGSQVVQQSGIQC
nr:hypothetical protein [Tanacetum cinerariifolium]